MTLADFCNWAQTMCARWSIWTACPRQKLVAWQADDFWLLFRMPSNLEVLFAHLAERLVPPLLLGEARPCGSAKKWSLAQARLGLWQVDLVANPGVQPPQLPAGDYRLAFKARDGAMACGEQTEQPEWHEASYPVIQTKSKSTK